MITILNMLLIANVAAVIFGFLAARQWYLASDAKVIIKNNKPLEIGDEKYVNLGVEVMDDFGIDKGLYIVRFGSLLKQGDLNKKAAKLTSLAVFFQATSFVITYFF